MSMQHSSQPRSLDPASLSSLIGMIYDCAIDPGHWEEALERIRLVLDMHNAALSVFDPSKLEGYLLNRSVGVPDEWNAVVGGYTPDLAKLWDGVLVRTDRPLDEPAVAMMECRDPYRTSRMYNEWGKPQGLCDLMGLVMKRDSAGIASLGMGRHESRGLIGARELDMMRLIAPHLRRAVTISGMIEVATIAAARFEAMLDVLSVGVVLVDRRGQVMHANRSARSTLAERAAVQIDRGALKVRSPSVDAALKRAIDLAAQGDAAMGAAGIGLPAAHPDGGGLVAHVLPLPDGNPRRQWIIGSVAAVFLTAIEQQGAIPTEALMALFDLTPAEARVVGTIGSGRTIGEAALELNVAETTVRTHLARLFSKTGTSRQADVVHLVGSLRAPLTGI